MAALDFPDNPTNGQVYDKWTWNGTAWVLTPSVVSPVITAGAGLVQNGAAFNVVSADANIAVTADAIQLNRSPALTSPSVSGNINMGVGSKIDFADEIGTKIDLYGGSFTIGVASGTTTYDGSNHTFRGGGTLTQNGPLSVNGPVDIGHGLTVRANLSVLAVTDVQAFSCTTLSATSTASISGNAYIYGAGISYPGATVAGENANLIGFRWGSSTLYGTVDNALWLVVGTASDRRLKYDIQDYADGLELIMALTPRSFVVGSFEVITDEDDAVEAVEFLVPDQRASEHRMAGLIADEVELVAPDLVGGETNDPKQVQSVNYQALITPLVQAVQDQQRQIEALTARIAALET